MKKYSVSVLILSCFLLLQSCDESFINLAPISSANVNSFYKSDQDFETAIVGVYDVFQSVNSTMWTEYLEFRGDTYTHTQYGYQEISNNTFTPNTTATMWNAMYRMINYSNAILSRTESITFNDETVKKKVTGEALFFRAYAYFALARIFGDVPLVTREVSGAEALQIGKSPLRDVYAQIVEDLTQSKELLPATIGTSQQGRVSKYAAAGILARVYITMSGYPLKENRWKEAKPLLEEIMNSGHFVFSPSYKDIFRFENEINDEIVLSAKFRSGGIGESTQYQRQFNAQYTQNPPIIEPGAYESYEAGDIRREANIALQFTNLQGSVISGQNNAKFAYGYDLASGESGMDFPLLRFTDVMLMYAEALSESDAAVVPESILLLNQVRDRAGLPELVPANIPDMMTFRQVVQRERRSELMFECVRWFDLVRTETAVEALRATGKNANENWLLFPLPQSEIDKMGGLLQQNPGY